MVQDAAADERGDLADRGSARVYVFEAPGVGECPGARLLELVPAGDSTCERDERYLCRR